MTYSLVQWEWTAAKFLWYLLFTFLTLFLFTYYGIMAIAITPSVQLAQVTSVLFYFLWNLFCGFLIPRPVSARGTTRLFLLFRFFLAGNLACPNSNVP